jgi:NAD+--dinitrogen-reductase ADP-D-ribosyltransferase
VLKGWVESRFGIPPAFHAGLIEDVHGPPYLLYLTERMRGSVRTNAIESQFDLLYEYAQYELRRRHPGARTFTLYRGVKNLEDYRAVGKTGETGVVLRLNSLNSFSSRLEHAWEFGSCVLVAEVPASKIFFRSDLLPGILPRGEEESLVIGGNYEVTVRLY